MHFANCEHGLPIRNAMDASTVKSARGRQPLKAAKAVRDEIRKRGKKPGNITFLYGAKVDRDWVLPSTLQLGVTLWAEWAQEISWYTADPDLIVLELGQEGFQGSKPDLKFQRFRGQRGLIEVKYSQDIRDDERAARQALIQQEHAHKVGYTWSWFEEQDAMRHRVALMNWLSISAVLKQFRAVDLRTLSQHAHEEVEAAGALSLGQMYARLPGPRAHVFVAIMRAHQTRALTVQLTERPLSLATEVAPWRPA